MTYAIISLICILLVLSIVYVVFFIVNKIVFNRYIQCLQKYDNILSQIITIAFTKLNALAEKNQPLKEKIGSLNIVRSQIIDNLNYCKQDFFMFADQLNRFHFSYCYKLIKECSKKIHICFLDFNKFKQEFENLSQYSHIIENTNYFYSQLVYDLENFYLNNMNDGHLKKINELFANARKSSLNLRNYSQENDILKVIKDINAIQNETNVLFETINNYYQLLVAKKHISQMYELVNSLMVEHNFSSIINKHNQEKLRKNQVIYQNSMANLNDKLSELEFENAFTNLHNAFNAYNDINIFIRTQIKAPELIKKSIAILDNQLHWFLNNKEQMTTNLLQTKKYFVCQQVNLIIDEIISNIEQLSLISIKIQNIDLTDQNNTKLIIDNLLLWSKTVLDIKSKIANQLSNLTNFIKKNIDFISHLNNLYILQNQLLIYTNELFTTQKKYEYENIISNHLNKINWYLQLLLDEHGTFNFKNLDDDLVLMDKTTKNIIACLNSQKIMKNLSTEMFIFANRYQHKYGSKLNNAKNLYQHNDFEKCLNTLIDVCKIAIS